MTVSRSCYAPCSLALQFVVTSAVGFATPTSTHTKNDAAGTGMVKRKMATHSVHASLNANGGSFEEGGRQKRSGERHREWHDTAFMLSGIGVHWAAGAITMRDAAAP